MPVSYSVQLNNMVSVDNTDSDNAGPSQNSPIKCKFGRFGESVGVIINETTVKCTSPPTEESPDNVYRESVNVGLAMNGVDFLDDEDSPEFTFFGTAPYVNFASILLTLGAIAFVLVALALCLQSGAFLGAL
jgi:hypothetical protein